MNIITKRVEELIPYENNPRINDDSVDAVANSIKEFGFKVPIVVDSNNIIITGHTRLKAAKKLGLKTVPVIVAEDLSDEQVKAFRIADNKVGENSEWNLSLLKKELDAIKNIDMTDFNIDFDDLNKEMLKMSSTNKEIKEDIVIEDNKNEYGVSNGDIWKLGNHYLLCGDSTDPKSYEKLLKGKKVDLVFTDPPYGMKKEKDGVANDNLNYDCLLEFNKKWIPLTFENLKSNGSWYCWGIDEPLMDIYAFILRPKIKNKECRLANLIVWNKVKTQGINQDLIRLYPRATEKCLFIQCGDGGVDDRAYFNNTHDKMIDVWEYNNRGGALRTWFRKEKEEGGNHPTVKPQFIVQRAIMSSSRENEVVLDVFGGSGSTLIACEELNRICYTIELSPEWCSTIIKRWENKTGKKAEKESNINDRNC